MNIRVDGLDELQKKLKNMPEQSRAAVKKELKIVAMDLKGKSQRLAPVDLGDLRGSAYDTESTEGGNLTAEVGFTEPYATRQHEEVGYRHPKGGEAKYLETPLKENIQNYIKAIGDAIMNALERKV